MQPQRSGFLPIADERIEAAWWGDEAASGPALVLLHEGLGSVGLWRDFPARLAAVTGRTVFAYSRLGYGRSSPCHLPRPLDYMQRESLLLPTVLRAAGISGRVVLAGHSDGATIAALHAGGDAADAIAGLVLIAPHMFVEPSCVAAIRDIRSRYRSDGLRDRLARHHDDPDGTFFGWADAWTDPAFPAVLDLRATLAAIRAPMLILQGTEDHYGTLAHARMAEALSGGPVRTIALACGHAPQQELPERSLDEICAFLRSEPGRSD